MDEHTLRLLEFEKIRSELQELSVSPEGKSVLAEEGFKTRADEVRDVLDLSLAFRAVLEAGTPLPAFDFPDISLILPRLGKGGILLDAEELAGIGRHILSALKMKRFILKSASHTRLRDMCQSIPDLGPLSRKIFHLLDPEGNLKEKRIPGLAAIKERIRRLREDAERAARGILDAGTLRGYWQTNLPTHRDGRLVLPLKAQYKGRIRGIIHELSSSGSTVFIEPMEIVDKNNAIVQEEELYRQEVRIILRELSAEVSRCSAELCSAVEAVGGLDALLARARYAVIHRCRIAEPSDGTAMLRDARHPLLGRECVPITVSAGGEYRILIITGPNTGGKTVSLKTVGLLALMNQFGMEIPAGDGSTLPVFDGVFADIGDEQSIAQSLSTFSAHVTNLARIMESATDRTLILLDELGAGTDPEEGVALAMALLDRLLEKGSTVLATTHHGVLKNYGYTRPKVQNASMGFDRESLSPTYSILMGVPGESHALEIARRKGIPETVIESAEEYLAGERTEISHIVKNLSERHQKLAQAEEQHRARETDLREKKRRADLKELSLKQKELELRRLGLKELRDFVSKARREWEEIKEKLPAAPSGKDEVSGLFGRMQERIEEEETRVSREHDALSGDADFEVRAGLEVLIRGTGRRGKVLRRDKGKRWIVETETMRLSLLPGEMRPAGKMEETRHPMISYSAAETADLPVLELNLRGLRPDEALRRLEKQIDSALVHGLKSFSVIHGKGEGVLMKAIHEYLKNLDLVEEFGFSLPEEGGAGKTNVVLKG
jgi:DNA mismatch repair protein MutS2